VRACDHKRPETVQEIELPLPEAGNIDEGFRSSQHREPAEQKDLIERIGDLSSLPMIWQILEIREENCRLGQSRDSLGIPIHQNPLCEPEDFDRFSFSFRCHALLHPIALGMEASAVARGRRIRYSTRRNSGFGADFSGSCQTSRSRMPVTCE
jgi:hypothetical protein